MTRDTDLIRDLLLFVEENDELRYAVDTGFTLPDDFQHLDLDVLGYHVHLLIEAGLVEGKVRRDTMGATIACFITRITWEGHEFLDNIRSETIWNRAKERVSQTAGSVSLSILKKVATKVAADIAL